MVLLVGVLGFKGQDVNAMELENVCLGRVILRLPVEREVVTASGRVDDVLVEALPAGSNPSLDAVRLAEIGYLTKQARGDVSPVTSEKMEDTFWVARYKTRVHRSQANAAHGVVITGGVALRLSSLGDETVIDEVAAAVTRVAQGLQPLGSRPRPPLNGFCLPPYHVVSLPYEGFNETVRLQYKLATGDILNFDTRTNNDEVPESLRQSLEKGEVELQQSVGRSLDYAPLEQIKNPAFEGDAAQLGTDGVDQVLIWRAPGRARDPDMPFIEITLRRGEGGGSRTDILGDIVRSLSGVGSE